MSLMIMFFVGLLTANGVPHFTSGIKGEDWVNPMVARNKKIFPGAPSSLINVIWGLLNFALGWGLFAFAGGFVPGPNAATAGYLGGFILASVGLSIFFHRDRKRRAEVRSADETGQQADTL